MNHVVKVWDFVCFGALMLVILATLTKAHSDDTYNFYFQKGGAPQSVIQSGKGQTATSDPINDPTSLAPQVEPPDSQPASPSPEQQKAPLPSPPTAASSPKPWNILLGYGRIDDDIGSTGAYHLGAQYNFNPYLGLRLQGHFTAAETESSNRSILDKNQGAYRYGGYSSLVFTPLRVELIGHQLLSVSAHAGLMSYREWEGSGINSDGQRADSVKPSIRGFLGASAHYTINENVGVEAFGSLLDGGKIGRIHGSIVFRF